MPARRRAVETANDAAAIGAWAIMLWVRAQLDLPPEKRTYWKSAHDEERMTALREAADLLGYAV